MMVTMLLVILLVILMMMLMMIPMVSCVVLLSPLPQVSSITKHFSYISDSITKMQNRDLLYDLVPYLTK